MDVGTIGWNGTGKGLETCLGEVIWFAGSYRHGLEIIGAGFALRVITDQIMLQSKITESQGISKVKMQKCLRGDPKNRSGGERNPATSPGCMKVSDLSQSSEFDL